MHDIEKLILTIKESDYTGPNGPQLKDVDFEYLEELVTAKDDEQSEFLGKLDSIHSDMKEISDIDELFKEWESLVDRLGKLL